MTARISRNAPCPCGSGRKYKACCLNKSRIAPAPPRPAEGGPARQRPLAPVFWLAALTVIVLLAFANSFGGVFLFDDITILNDARLHHLFPVTEVIKNSNRPLFHLSLAINYHLGGTDPWGYHLFNLMVHLLAAGFLFGFIRLTLAHAKTISGEHARRADLLAFCIALLWAVHPMQTASVTYVIQRAESLMGMFYLAVMFAAAQCIRRTFHPLWAVAAVAACALGMGVKEVMATAPVIVLFYDRLLMAGEFKEIFARCLPLYAGLAVSWVIPAVLLTQTTEYLRSAGFGMENITPLEYALTQPGVILHYLRLSVVPAPLVLDYVWAPARGLQQILPPLLGVAFLLGLTAWAARRRPALGFLGLWFFGILSVSSSFIPIADLAFEHRMYLSLAAVMALFVLGLDGLARRITASWENRQTTLLAFTLCVAAVLSAMTHARNIDYASRVAMARDTLRKRPGNTRAYNDLGHALLEAGRWDEALSYLKEAIQRRPDYAEALNNIGLVLREQSRTDEARSYFERAVEADPDYVQAVTNLGLAFAELGQPDKARAMLSRAVALKPDYAKALNNLGVVLKTQGHHAQALEYFRRALALWPEYPEALRNVKEVEGFMKK